MRCIILLGKWLLGSIVFLFLVVMAVIISINSIKYFFPYSQPSPFLLSKRDWFVLYLPALYGHIVTSGIILVVGFLQFSTLLQTKYKPVHHFLGKVYVFLVLFVSAPCGLVMSFFAVDRGFTSLFNFLILSVLWWTFTYKGYSTIKQGYIQQHRIWMLRSYALTLSAVALRCYSALFVYYLDWKGENAYVTAAILSWVPNLLLVEIYALLQKKQSPIS